MSRKNNILFVCPIKSNFKTGAAIATEYISNELKRRGVQIFFINTAIGVTESNIRKITFKRSILTLLIVIKFFKNLLLSQKVYIVVSMSSIGFIRDAAFIIFSKLFFKKVILHLHGAGFKSNFYNKKPYLFKKFIALIYTFSDRLILLSKNIEKDFCFIEKEKKIVLPNFIINNKKNIEYSIKERDFKKIKIIYLSNMIYSKGYMTLLETCNILKKNSIDFSCIFIGKFVNDYVSTQDFLPANKLKELFIKKINDYNLQNFIKLNENFDIKSKFNILASNNLFVLPTFYNGEGLPLSIIEAMSCGLPIISTNQGAISDLVINNYNGFVLEEKKNPNECAEKIFKLNSNNELFKKMSYNSLKHYRDFYTLEKIKPKIYEAFKI